MGINRFSILPLLPYYSRKYASEDCTMIWHRRLALLLHVELLSHLASHQFLSNIRMAIEQSDATAFPALKLAQPEQHLKA